MGHGFHAAICVTHTQAPGIRSRDPAVPRPSRVVQSEDSSKCGNVRTLLPASTVDRLEAAGAEETLRVNVVHASGALRAVDVRVGIVEEDGVTSRIAVMRDVSNQVERERRLVEFQWQIQMGRQVIP